MKIRALSVCTLALACTAGAAHAQSFVQSFDDVLALPGLGWHLQNNSNPIGTTGWFQGNTAVFAPYGTTGYIGANFNNTAGVGTISNWLLTPAVTINNGDQIRFLTRRPDVTEWADRLEVRMSTAGSSTNVGTLATDVGDFTTLMLTINPNLIWTEYPGEWTAFTATVSGLPGSVTGRFAFRYYVDNAGPSGLYSDYIGIDEVQFGAGGIATGACCTPSGCSITSAHECSVRSGNFLGTGTLCANCPAGSQGACCMADGACNLATQTNCIAAGGVYRGDGTTCGDCPNNYTYTGGTVMIPDGSGTAGCGLPAILDIVVQDSFTVDSVHTALHIQHTWQGDVRARLRHVPTGTTAMIIDRPGVLAGVSTFGFSNPDYGTFASLFRTTPSALLRYNRPDVVAGINQVAGSWRPDQSLAAFAGLNSQGTWRLEVEDCAGGDTGMAHVFILSLQPAGGPACYANCDASTIQPVLNIDDFTCFINSFAAGLALPHAQQVTHYANCDQSTTAPVLNIDDFTCFINSFAQGCP